MKRRHTMYLRGVLSIFGPVGGSPAMPCRSSRDGKRARLGGRKGKRAVRGMRIIFSFSGVYIL